MTVIKTVGVDRNYASSDSLRPVLTFPNVVTTALQVKPNVSR
jgi:hypothetical protein